MRARSSRRAAEQEMAKSGTREVGGNRSGQVHGQVVRSIARASPPHGIAL